jgi:hypothetical protein
MSLTLAEALRLWDELPVPVDEGMAEVELARVERIFGFRFNPDHRVLLAAGLPLGGRWPDWRDPESPTLVHRLGEPVNGVLFDVAENGFWYPAWGPRPADLADALDVARAELAEVPRLVPVYGHRYAPALPEDGLPVLSVVQTDVVVYGTDLDDYLRREFGLPPAEATQAKPVPFWYELT